MKDSRFKVLCVVLTTVFLLSSGCAAAQKTRRTGELESEIAQLTQSIEARDARIAQLQELLDAQQRRFQEQESQNKKALEKLRNELDRLKRSAKKQPDYK